MKSLVVSAFGCLTLASVALFAEGPNNPANFEIAKKQMSEMAEKRMAVIKDFKSCVDAANRYEWSKRVQKKRGPSHESFATTESASK